MKIYKALITMLMCLCFMINTLPAAAQQGAVSVNVSFDAEKSELNIFGEAYGKAVITVALFELPEEVMSPEILPSVIRQIETDGEYAIDIAMPYDSAGGKYTVYVSTAQGKASTNFLFINNIEAENVIQSLKTAKSLSEFQDIIIKNTASIGIEGDDEGFIKNKDKITQMLYKEGFADIVEFSRRYSKIYALNVIQGAENEEALLILKKYAYQLGIDYADTFVNDGRIDEKARSEMLDILAQFDYSQKYDADGIIHMDEIIEQSKATACFRISNSWVIIKRLMTETFADIFDTLLDNDKYKVIADKNAVFEIMMLEEISDFESINTAFKNAVAYVYKNENSSAGRSTGSRGSSGSVSGAITVPITTEDESKPTEKIVFVDMDETYWSFEAVSALVQRNIINGYEDGSFMPQRFITRAEFVKMILYAAGDNTVNEKRTEFDDVGEDDWFYPYITKAYALGYVNGNGKYFLPSTNITREDAAVIVFRVLDAMGKAPVGFKNFKDRNEISEYAKSQILALGSCKIVQGDENNMFVPKDNLTRAQAAQLLYNAFVSE